MKKSRDSINAFNLRAGPRLALKSVKCIVLPLLVSGCAAFQGTHTSREELLQSGSIGISRPIPSVATLTNRPPLLGFIPTRHTQSAARLEILRDAQKIIFVDSSGARREFSGVGFDALRQGTFSITLKQQDPLWYAPNSYFQDRGLEIPAEGSRERFRRGALGGYAVFLSDQSAIHSGPAARAELNGVQMQEPDLKVLCENLEIGMAVKVL